MRNGSKSEQRYEPASTLTTAEVILRGASEVATKERANERGRGGERARSARSDGRGRERGAKYPSDDRAARSDASQGAVRNGSQNERR